MPLEIKVSLNWLKEGKVSIGAGQSGCMLSLLPFTQFGSAVPRLKKQEGMIWPLVCHLTAGITHTPQMRVLLSPAAEDSCANNGLAVLALFLFGVINSKNGLKPFSLYKALQPCTCCFEYLSLWIWAINISKLAVLLFLWFDCWYTNVQDSANLLEGARLPFSCPCTPV